MDRGSWGATAHGFSQGRLRTFLEGYLPHSQFGDRQGKFTGHPGTNSVPLVGKLWESVPSLVRAA